MTKSHTGTACHAVRTPFPPLNLRVPRSKSTIYSSHKSGKPIRETYIKYPVDIRQGPDLVGQGNAKVNKAASLAGQRHEN